MKYVPDAREKKKYKKLLAKNTSAEALYRQYHIDAKYFVEDFPLFYAKLSDDQKHQLGIQDVKLLYSILFKKKYLAAFTNTKEWFTEGVGRFHDAFTSNEFYLLDFHAPPLVFIPCQKKNSKDKETVATLEHEFVHINQAILKRVSPFKEDKTPNDLLDYLFEMISLEYEAYFIQLVKYPFMFPYNQVRGSLDDWCILRAFTQALEKVLYSGLESKVQTEPILKFLEFLPDEILKRFKKLGFSELTARQYRGLLENYIMLALTKYMNHSSSQNINRHFLFAIDKWLKKRMPADEYKSIAPKE